jgi:hypothetical protein
MAQPPLPEKILENPLKSFDQSMPTPPLGPPPHGPLLEWHLHNGHFKKVHSLNSHQGAMKWGAKGGTDQSKDFSGFSREAGESREHPYSLDKNQAQRMGPSQGYFVPIGC